MCVSIYLLGMHHQTITGMDPSILQLLHIPSVYTLSDHCHKDIEHDRYQIVYKIGLDS